MGSKARAIDSGIPEHVLKQMNREERRVKVPLGRIEKLKENIARIDGPTTFAERVQGVVQHAPAGTKAITYLKNINLEAIEHLKTKIRHAVFGLNESEQMFRDLDKTVADARRQIEAEAAVGALIQKEIDLLQRKKDASDKSIAEHNSRLQAIFARIAAAKKMQAEVLATKQRMEAELSEVEAKNERVELDAMPIIMHGYCRELATQWNRITDDHTQTASYMFYHEPSSKVFVMAPAPVNITDKYGYTAKERYVLRFFHLLAYAFRSKGGHLALRKYPSPEDPTKYWSIYEIQSSPEILAQRAMGPGAQMHLDFEEKERGQHTYNINHLDPDFADWLYANLV